MYVNAPLWKKKHKTRRALVSDTTLFVLNFFSVTHEDDDENDENQDPDNNADDHSSVRRGETCTFILFICTLFNVG